jgi:hypothetical protein
VFFDCGGNWLCVIVPFGKGAKAQGQIKSDHPRLEPTLPKFTPTPRKRVMATKKKKAKKKSK